jgi:4-amino-4-deoxy-L-arabinose transferase-like glycosyltransferase
MESQFYAAIVPIIFSLGLVLTAFFIGKLLFSDMVGLYAALLVTIHPVSIMTAQKLWADDMVSFFLNLAFVFFLLGQKREKDWLFFIAGLSLGIGVMAKQTAGYAVFGLVPYFYLTHRKNIFDFRNWPAIVFDRRILFFTAGIFAVTAGWFYRAYTVYDSPIYNPGQDDILKRDLTGWFRVLQSRPQGYVLYTAGLVYFCPLFGLAFITLGRFFREALNLLKSRGYDHRFIFIWLNILVYFMWTKTEQEDRHFLPMYPLMAVLAAYMIGQFRRYLAERTKTLDNRILPDLVILCLFVICALWSVPIGIDTGLNETILLNLPFWKK